MSIDNSELLMLLGGKKSKSIIGKAGKRGFGVGVYAGSSSDLKAMGLTPMEGCEDPNSENYGNYVHANGSIMCCIPAFCYRLGNTTAPSYSRDGADALEIRDATEFPQFSHDAAFSSPDFGDGWILHRAFVDGNKLKSAFFIDKYLCSNVNGQAASVKNADWLMCYSDTSKTFYTKSISGTIGQAYDAIALSRARGAYYSLVTCYQWSAISLLSLAHGQAATSEDACAWYDADHTTNFPKGATDTGGKDCIDYTVKYTIHAYGSTFAKTGSSTSFNKTTHNGQASGVADVAGMCNQWTIGALNTKNETLWLMNTTETAHGITKDNVAEPGPYTSYSTGIGDGKKSFNGVRSGTSGLDWVGAGIVPKTTSGSTLFGDDEYREKFTWPNGLMVGLGSRWGYPAGVFCRSWYSLGSDEIVTSWTQSSRYFGFRSAGYPP
nr:MAG TPA: hypothetical protein [Caudoviricetes sp.]